MVERLADLRKPPVAGRYYDVPAIRHKWHGVEADWPVLGPMHTDADFFAFPQRHYHVDARFVSAKLARRVRASDYPGGVAGMAQSYPLTRRYGAGEPDLPSGRPAVTRLRCRTADFPYNFEHQPAVEKLRAYYGKAVAIALPDGRRLCPHRKVDLSQIAPDADGLVTCPLHGLRVCVVSARP